MTDDQAPPPEDTAVELSDLRVHAGSTRAVTLRGRGGERVSFAREALEGMAQQARDRFVPISIEHLDFLPPIGRWRDGELVSTPDGETDLYLVGGPLRQLVPVGPDPDPLSLIAKMPVAEPLSEVNAVVVFEHSNFERTDLVSIRDEAPIPVESEERWSELPPLIWTLAIPVTWGAMKFAGAFFETLGKATADAVVGWVRRAWNRSKEPERDRLLTLRFDLPDGASIYGFIPSAFDDPEAEANLQLALASSGELASLAGAQLEQAIFPGLQRAAFIFDGAAWRLAWWTDGEGVYRTNWFERYAPDPSRFLGRPLLGLDFSPSDPEETDGD